MPINRELPDFASVMARAGRLHDIQQEFASELARAERLRDIQQGREEAGKWEGEEPWALGDDPNETAQEALARQRREYRQQEQEDDIRMGPVELIEMYERENYRGDNPAPRPVPYYPYDDDSDSEYDGHMEPDRYEYHFGDDESDASDEYDRQREPHRYQYDYSDVESRSSGDDDTSSETSTSSSDSEYSEALTLLYPDIYESGLLAPPNTPVEGYEEANADVPHLDIGEPAIPLGTHLTHQLSNAASLENPTEREVSTNIIDTDEDISQTPEMPRAVGMVFLGGCTVINGVRYESESE